MSPVIEALEPPDHGLERDGAAGLGVDHVDAQRQAAAQEQLFAAAVLECNLGSADDGRMTSTPPRLLDGDGVISNLELFEP